MAVSAIKVIEHGHEVIKGVLCDATSDVPTNVKDEAVVEFELRLGSWIVDTEAKASYYISDVDEEGTITTQQFASF